MPGCGSPGERGEKKSGIDPVSRTADWPGQTLNVDLCFVPVSHLADVKLPAVSGSSGHLVVERVKEVGQEPDYPGKVFADLELGYAEAIQAFVAASQPLFGPKIGAVGAEKISPQAEIKQLRQAEAQLCVERCNIRKRRKLEDAAWRVIWNQQRDVPRERGAGTLRARWGSRKAQEQQRKNLRQQQSSAIGTAPTGRRTMASEPNKFAGTNDLAPNCHGLDRHSDDHR